MSLGLELRRQSQQSVPCCCTKRGLVSCHAHRINPKVRRSTRILLRLSHCLADLVRINNVSWSAPPIGVQDITRPSHQSNTFPAIDALEFPRTIDKLPMLYCIQCNRPASSVYSICLVLACRRLCGAVTGIITSADEEHPVFWVEEHSMLPHLMSRMLAWPLPQQCAVQSEVVESRTLMS